MARPSAFQVLINQADVQDLIRNTNPGTEIRREGPDHETYVGQCTWALVLMTTGVSVTYSHQLPDRHRETYLSDVLIPGRWYRYTDVGIGTRMLVLVHGCRR